MKKLVSSITLLFFSFLCCSLLGQNPSMEWALGVGGTSSDQAHAISIDHLGNVIITGSFENTVDFDPGTNTSNLTSSGSNSDIFIQKLDRNGNLVWVKGIIGSGIGAGRDITTDDNGNIYIAGSFGGTMDFGLGTSSNLITSNGTTGFDDIFIMKLDSTGNLTWVKTIGGHGYDIAFSIALDHNNDIVVSGSFSGMTVDFDPGTGVANLNANGYDNTFILKLDNNGNYNWAKHFSMLTNRAWSMTLDQQANIYLTGDFYGTTDFDPGVGTRILTPTVSPNSYIAKLDSNGNYIWAHKLEGNGSSSGYAIKIDNDNNVFSTGRFYGTVDFLPGTGTLNLSTSNFNDDIYVWKLTANGGLHWAKGMGSTSVDKGLGITLDAEGSVYTTGFFYGTVDFDPGSLNNTLNSNGSGDVFIQKLDSAGNFNWAFNMGASSSDEGIDLTIDQNGFLYTTGIFRRTIDLDPEGTVNLVSSNGSTDYYIQKLDPSLVTNIGKIDKANIKYKLFPNPSTGVVNFQFDPIDHLAVGHIYTSTGTLVEEFKLIEGNNLLDLSNLSNGFYFIEYQEEYFKLLMNK